MAQNMLIAKFPTMICHRPLPVTIYDITATPEPRSEIMDASFAYSIVDDIQPVDLECARYDCLPLNAIYTASRRFNLFGNASGCRSD